MHRDAQLSLATAPSCLFAAPGHRVFDVAVRDGSGFDWFVTVKETADGVRTDQMAPHAVCTFAMAAVEAVGAV